MPAAKLGDRLAMEAALGNDMLVDLREVCRLLGVRPDRWHQVPGVARLFSTVAGLRLAEELEDRDGLSQKEALEAAAVTLGLNLDTLASRVRRWFLDGYG